MAVFVCLLEFSRRSLLDELSVDQCESLLRRVAARMYSNLTATSPKEISPPMSAPAPLQPPPLLPPLVTPPPPAVVPLAPLSVPSTAPPLPAPLLGALADNSPAVAPASTAPVFVSTVLFTPSGASDHASTASTGTSAGAQALKTRVFTSYSNRGSAAVSARLRQAAGWNAPTEFDSRQPFATYYNALSSVLGVCLLLDKDRCAKAIQLTLLLFEPVICMMHTGPYEAPICQVCERALELLLRLGDLHSAARVLEAAGTFLVPCLCVCVCVVVVACVCVSS